MLSDEPGPDIKKLQKLILRGLERRLLQKQQPLEATKVTHCAQILDTEHGTVLIQKHTLGGGVDV